MRCVINAKTHFSIKNRKTRQALMYLISPKLARVPEKFYKAAMIYLTNDIA